MLRVNLLLVLVSLLTENVQAVDTYLGNNMNWIHKIPKPLSKSIEVERVYNTDPENKEPVSLDKKLTENYYYRSTAIPNYQLLPQRDPLLSPTRPELLSVTIGTEPTVEEPQTTSLYTNPPEIPTFDGTQDFNTKLPSRNPSLGRALVTKPIPRPQHIELNRPQPGLEEITTIASLPTVSIVENISNLNLNPTIDNTKPEAAEAVVLRESQLTSITEEPEIEILKNTPKLEPETVNHETVLETLSEKVEESPKPEFIVAEKKELIRPEYDIVVIKNYPSLSQLVPIRGPEIDSRPYRVPKPVVSSPRAKLLETLPPLVALRKLSEPKPFFKSLLTLNSEPAWTMPASTQLYDYQCKEANGYYSITGDCDSYVVCKKHTAIMYSCPDGLHYNPRARWPDYPCGYPSEVKCESNSVRQVAHPTHKCPQQFGFYPIPDLGCSKYVMCEEGKTFVMNCPPGLAFNDATSSCDWPENVPSCNLDVFQGVTCPAPPLEKDGSSSDLIFKYRYRESCKEYIACQHGHPRLLRCDAGLSFDEKSEFCVDSDYVSNC